VIARQTRKNFYYFKRKKIKVGEHTIKLKEGAAIFDEAIHYLLNIRPFELCEGLSESAN